jgi:putative ATP-dependent endonuclease of OLD family
MGNQWRNLHSDLRYNRVKVTFSNEDLNAVLRKLDVRFFPTEIPGSYDVDALGEGLRSLFYLSLVSSLLEIEAIASQERAISQAASAEEESKSPRIFNPDFEPPVLTILAVEEPENHIAPHLLGRVMERLHQVASQPNAQVVVTSHTPTIVARVEPESIRHLRICKDRLCTISSPIRIPDKVDEAHKYVKEAVRAYPEIYFARLVILGEGDTEEIIIPKALKSLGPSLDASGICVVPLGGRFVNHFWQLLTEIGIPYITVLDLDLGRHSGGWARIQYVVNQLIHNGISRAHLVSTLGGRDIFVSAEGLDNIQDWDEDRKAIEPWLRALESYDVFFASPLDMDFMMLQSFKDSYQALTPERGGPRIPNRHLHPNAFRERLDQAVRATLKADSVGSSLYGEGEELLMVWYAYLFLNRGKPSTHILALSKMSDEEYEKYLPQPIVRLRERVKKKLVNDPFSQLFINEKT